METQNNRGLQLEIMVDSGASEDIVSDELYLTDVKEFTPVTVGWANGT